jgi:hypothetical protein
MTSFRTHSDRGVGSESVAAAGGGPAPSEPRSRQRGPRRTVGRQTLWPSSCRPGWGARGQSSLLTIWSRLQRRLVSAAPRAARTGRGPGERRPTRCAWIARRARTGAGTSVLHLSRSTERKDAEATAGVWLHSAAVGSDLDYQRRDTSLGSSVTKRLHSTPQPPRPFPTQFQPSSRLATATAMVRCRPRSPRPHNAPSRLLATREAGFSVAPPPAFAAAPSPHLTALRVPAPGTPSDPPPRR